MGSLEQVRSFKYLNDTIYYNGLGKYKIKLHIKTEKCHRLSEISVVEQTKTKNGTIICALCFMLWMQSFLKHKWTISDKVERLTNSKMTHRVQAIETVISRISRTH